MTPRGPSLTSDPPGAAELADAELPVTRPRTRSPLDVPHAQTGTPLVAGAGAVLVHAFFVLIAAAIGAQVTRSVAPAAISELIEVELPQPAPEPPAPEPETPTPAPAVHVQRQRVATPEPEPTPAPAPEAPPPEAPPPAAAQAAEVLTAESDTVDFGETIVTGNAAIHAGGTTQEGGTSTVAARDTNARANGVVGGTGTQPQVNRARTASLAGGARWDCPFPEEADEEEIDHAVVTLKIAVGVDGTTQSVEVVSDPGDGFGREAKRCALRKRFQSALDRAGTPIASTALINVRFDR